jgi:hypothetical protein
LKNSIDQLLRRRLDQGTDLPATDACVDAETLAAWMDGSLSGEGLDRAEHHAAGCRRCQAMLASMARTAPETAARSWWRTLTVKWVVPMAAAATAAVVWVSLGHDRSAPVTVSAPVLPVSTSAAADRIEAPPAEAATPSPKPSQIAPPPSEHRAKEALSPRTLGTPDLLAERKSQPAVSAGAGVGGQTPAAESAAPKAPAETVAATEPRGRVAMDAMSRAAFAITTVDIPSPEPAFRWRLTTPATIQRSIDGGVTWSPQVAPGGLALTTGASPARDVCWIVGRGGAVVLSTDGTLWQRRPFPEAVDLVAVRPIDAKAAIVTATDGRQFSTADGGATWSKLP